MKRLKVNAQITALTTFIEFVGNITMVLHLYFAESNAYASFIHTMAFYLIVIPYAFLMNTNDNKWRIIDSGWRNIFKNLIGMKSNQLNNSTDRPSYGNVNNEIDGSGNSQVITSRNEGATVKDAAGRRPNNECERDRRTVKKMYFFNLTK